MTGEAIEPTGIPEEAPLERKIGEILAETLGEDDLAQLNILAALPRGGLSFEEKNWLDQILTGAGVDMATRVLSIENLAPKDILSFTPTDLYDLVDFVDRLGGYHSVGC